MYETGIPEVPSLVGELQGLSIYPQLRHRGWQIRFHGGASVPGCSSGCQVQDDTDLANYFRPRPDGYSALRLLGWGDVLVPQDPSSLVTENRRGVCRRDVRTEAGQEAWGGKYLHDLPHPQEVALEAGPPVTVNP